MRGCKAWSCRDAVSPETLTLREGEEPAAKLDGEAGRYRQLTPRDGARLRAGEERYVSSIAEEMEIRSAANDLGTAYRGALR